MGIKTVSFSLFLIICLPSLAWADGAFKWTGQNGQTIYGTRPPNGAQGVKSLGSIQISRYSSSKIIKQAKKAAAKKSAAQTAPAVPSPAALAQGRLNVSLDAAQRITACKVEVNNTGGELARGVLVSFEFQDGTMVPGMGPDSIAASSQAVYFVPPEQLPISVQGRKDDQKPKDPKVLVQFNQN